MKTVLTVTGGGSHIFDTLLTKGGASSYFLEGNIPYCCEATDAFLGYKPEKYCSDKTARQLALKSFQRALLYGVTPSEAQGVACTATLRKKEERPGRRHFFHIALSSLLKTYSWECEFYPDFDREEQERLVSYALESIVENGDLILKYQPFTVIKNRQTDVYGLADVLTGKSKYRLVGTNITDLPDKSLIYPGSFNPLHGGHIAIIDWANKYLGCKPYIEVSVVNPDKPILDYIDINERIINILNQIEDKISGIIVSNLSMFILKIWTYKSPRFLVGIDTFNRVFDSKYYLNKPQVLSVVADDVKTYDSFFYVLDRKGYQINNTVVEQFKLQNHVQVVPTEQYEDIDGISSTQIRQGVR